MTRHRLPRLVAALALLVLMGANPCGPKPPFGKELLANGGFEDGVLAPWVVDQGSCEVEFGPTFPFSDAHTGDWLFYGGDEGVVASCRASQPIDLLARKFRERGIDLGLLELDAEAWLHNWNGALSFDDQIFYRVRFLDESFAELGSLRTLIGGEPSWVLREMAGMLPEQTRHLRAELEARFRLGADNDGFADDVSLAVNLATPASPSITKLPQLQDVQQDRITILWETDANLAQHAVEYGLSGAGLTDVETRTETTQIVTLSPRLLAMCFLQCPREEHTPDGVQ